MAFGSFDSKSPTTTMSEINMIPLIDVMLVLLVIFMITAPLLTQAIHINVPQTATVPAREQPPTVDLAINADGDFFWNNKPVALADLKTLFMQQAALDPQPEIRIRADTDARYGLIAQILASARSTGIKRLGFVTQPDQHPLIQPGTARGAHD